MIGNQITLAIFILCATSANADWADLHGFFICENPLNQHNPRSIPF